MIIAVPMQAKLLQALWLYMPPYVNSTASIFITDVSSTAARRRRRLQASAGTADVTTEFDVTATAVAATASHLTSVVSSSTFLVGNQSPLLCDSGRRMVSLELDSSSPP